MKEFSEYLFVSSAAGIASTLLSFIAVPALGPVFGQFVASSSALLAMLLVADAMESE